MKTIPVSDQAHFILSRWKKVRGETFEQFINSWIEDVANKKQQEFYNSLGDPRGIKNDKPLKNTKLKKFYKN